MKRASKLAEFRKYLSTHCFSRYNHERNAEPSASAAVRFFCQDATQTPSRDRKGTNFRLLVSLFSDKLSYYHHADTICEPDLKAKVAGLRKEILDHKHDSEKIEKILDENGVPLFRRYSDGDAIIELLRQLKHFPSVAMEVLEWRRKQDYTSLMTVEEYAKGISIASKMNQLDVAVELFKEASNKQLKGTSLYDALMSAYMRSGLNMKCQSVFHELKRDPTCAPSIVSYNILISSFGRLMLIDHMEASFKELNDLKLDPNVDTYKALIIGYMTAWRWDDMEKTYMVMRERHVKPNLEVNLLMHRGYALARKVEKMEEIYKMVRDHVYDREIHLIRNMVHAYCKSSNASRVHRVEELLRKIPKNEYRPWFNVMLIRFYATEGLLEQMENSINEALEHKIYVTTSGVMKCIAANYFRHHAVDKLDDFLQRAEIAGWILSKSLYHCKMEMYAKQMRLSDMERVLREMDRLHMPLTMKTYWILYDTYKSLGETSKLEQVIGVLCKKGYRMHKGA